MAVPRIAAQKGSQILSSSSLLVAGTVLAPPVPVRSEFVDGSSQAPLAAKLPTVLPEAPMDEKTNSLTRKVRKVFDVQSHVLSGKNAGVMRVKRQYLVDSMILGVMSNSLTQLKQRRGSPDLGFVSADLWKPIAKSLLNSFNGMTNLPSFPSEAQVAALFQGTNVLQDVYRAVQFARGCNGPKKGELPSIPILPETVRVVPIGFEKKDFERIMQSQIDKLSDTEKEGRMKAKEKLEQRKRSFLSKRHANRKMEGFLARSRPFTELIMFSHALKGSKVKGLSLWYEVVNKFRNHMVALMADPLAVVPLSGGVVEGVHPLVLDHAFNVVVKEALAPVAPSVLAESGVHFLRDGVYPNNPLTEFAYDTEELKELKKEGKLEEAKISVMQENYIPLTLAAGAA